MNKRFIKEKSFYINVLAITIPIALQNLIVFGVTLADNLMLGRIGDAQISACAQANQPGFVFQVFIFGCAGGGCVLAAQYWGKKDIQSVKKVITIVVKLVLMVSIILSVVVYFNPEKIMSLYLKQGTQAERYVFSEAISYLKIISISYIFLGISMSFTNIVRSVEIVRISVISSCVSFIVNVIMNWILIFGNLGAPRLGVKGAAIGTLIARICDCLIVLIYIFVVDKRVKLKFRDFFKNDILMLKDYFKYSVPVIGNELAWSLGISIQAAILGKISTDILAASSIAINLQQIVLLVTFGTASAASVFVGKRIGEGKKEEAKNIGITFMIWSVILGVSSSVVVLILRKPYISLFNISDSVRGLTMNLLLITAVLVIFISVAVNGIVGVLRAAGDIRYCFILEILTLWIIAIPLGIISENLIGAPVLVTYSCLKIDEIIKAVFAFKRTLRDSTYKSVTRDLNS